MKKLKAYYLFGDSPLPESIEGEIMDIIESVRSSKSKQEALDCAYKTIVSRYQGGRLKTLGRIHDLFAESWQDLWNRTGFLHCTNQNYLLALILVKSGRFKPADIKRKWTLIWLISPHQYLSVRLNQSWIDVDCWAKDYGIVFGKHASNFNTSVFKSN